MRICHVCSGHPSDDGRVFHRQCVALADAGYEVHLIAVSERREPFVQKGVTIHPLPPCSSNRRRLLRSGFVARMAADLHADLYHVHEPELLGPVLARVGSRPVIWDVHEFYLDVITTRHWIPRGLRPLIRSAWDRQERRLVRRCVGVILVSDRLEPRYRDLHSNVVLVANYPDLATINSLPSVPRDGKTCVFAGTLAPNRGLFEAFRALAILRGRQLDIPLSLAGRPISAEFLGSLLGEAKRLGIADLVTYHGVVSKSEAAVLQHGASIGLVPHLPFGNNVLAVPVKLVEFMGHGLPMVFSNLPNHRELARGAGIPVDPSRPEEIADAIERLVRNPDLARALGERGRQIATERLNWETERPKLLQLYHSILGPPGRNGDWIRKDPEGTKEPVLLSTGTR